MKEEFYWSREERFNKLLDSMGKCQQCSQMMCGRRDVSLINIYKDKEFSKNIPSIWTDWFKRLDSKIMIIGQDWGPYEDMKKLNEEYKAGEKSYKELIESEKSLTKRNLEKFIYESSLGKVKSLDDIFITNAIMCARKGNDYRGDNIDLVKASKNCSDFLLQQIGIINPKVIVTLGYYPLKALADRYYIEIDKTLKETIEKHPTIQSVFGFVIIPAYHPAAQVSHEEQLKQYRRIWEIVSPDSIRRDDL